MAVTVQFSDSCLAIADRRVFCNGRPRLAEALLQRLQQLPDVSFASLDLSLGFCRIGWRPEMTAKQAADSFIAALQAALRQELGPENRRRNGRLRRRQSKPV